MNVLKVGFSLVSAISVVLLLLLGAVTIINKYDQRKQEIERSDWDGVLHVEELEQAAS